MTVCHICKSELKSFHGLHFEMGDLKDGMSQTPFIISDCYKCVSCGHIVWQDKKE